MKSTTLAEVARHAGLSTATVARVLKEQGYVSEEARTRVKAAVKATHYRPNAVARSLRKQRSLTIGHVLTLITVNPFFVNVARAAEDEALASDFKTFLFNHNGSAERERLGVERLIERRVDAILFTVAVAQSNVLLLREAGIPAVQIERAVTLEAPAVTVDNVAGALEAMRHLAELGHTRIAFIGGDPNLISHGNPLMRVVEDERLGAYHAGLKAAGITFDPEYMRLGPYYAEIEGESSGIHGYRHMKALLDLPDRPSAVFATCDILAAGALQALYEAQLRVPEDISLIGFDDTLAANLTPPLTTVAQPMDELGRQGFRVALSLITGQHAPSIKRLPSRLVIRRSTGQAP